MKINLLKVPAEKRGMHVKDFVDNITSNVDEMNDFFNLVRNKHIILLVDNNFYAIGKVVSVDKGARQPSISIDGLIVNEASFSSVRDFGIVINGAPKYVVISDESYNINYYGKLSMAHELALISMNYYHNLAGVMGSKIELKPLRKPGMDMFDVDSEDLKRHYPSSTIEDVIGKLWGEYNQCAMDYKKGLETRSELKGKVLLFNNLSSFDILLPLTIDGDTGSVDGLAIHVFNGCVGADSCVTARKVNGIDSSYAYVPLTVINDDKLNDTITSLAMSVWKSYNKILHTADILLKNKRSDVE